MMKHSGKRILSVLTAVILLVCGMPFAAVAEHVHVYDDVTVVEPGYMFGGYTIYRCSCGDYYTDDPTSPVTQPYCVMTGARVAPGDSVTVQARLQHCSGLEDLIVDLAYNEFWLHLTSAECAEYGTPERRSDKALYFASIDPAVQEAVLLLTFDVDVNAPTGEQTVSVSGCGFSAYPADCGDQISMTAQTASLMVYRPFKLLINAPDKTLYAGDTVQMTVDLADNTGVAGMDLELVYDPQVLTLTDIQASGMFESGSLLTSGELSYMPFRVLWDDATASTNHYETGTILTLTFAVKADAPAGPTQVQMTFDPDDVLDVQLKSVEMVASGAVLSIEQRISGDVDCDGDVDLADVVTLSRYLAKGWNARIDAVNSDVDHNGAVNLKDVVLIRRYLAGGWDVTLS